MSVANKIFSNTLWQVVIRTINILIGVFNLALLTRILGQTGFGYFTTVFAFVQVLMILADLGLYIALLKEISTVESREQENKIVNNIFTIRVISSLFIVILAPIAVQFFPYDQAVKTGVIFFVVAFFFQSLISTLTAVFSKKLAMPKVAITDSFNKLVFFVSLIYLFKAGSNLNTILLINSVFHALTFGLLYIFLRKYVFLKFAWDFAYWKKLWHVAWPLAATVVLNLIYFKGDILILSAFASPEVVAIYGAPYRVLEVLAAFPHMFMSLILPLFTAAWLSKNIDKLRKIFQHSFDFFIILAVPMVVGSFLISRPLMVALAGPDFAASGPILNILVLATVNIFFGVLFTYLIVALGLQRKMIKYYLTVAILGLVGYFIFIPMFSYWGAAYMTLAVEVLLWILAAWLVRKHIKLHLKLKVFYKSILAGIITLAVAWLWRDNILLTVVISVVVYLGILYFTKAVDKDLLKQVFKKQT